MALTATSTIDDALGQLNANLAWEGDATAAEAFLEAGRFLLFNQPESHAGQQVTVNWRNLQKELDRAAAYVASQGATAAAARARFTRVKFIPR